MNRTEKEEVIGQLHAKMAKAKAAILSGETKVLTVYPADKAFGSPGQSRFTIPSRFTIEKIGINFNEGVMDMVSAPVRFFPNGTSDEFTIVISDHGRDKRIIELDVVTALPDVDTEESYSARHPGR